MKFVSKTATEPVYRNALFQTCAMRMKSNAAKQISQLVYGPIVLEMIFVFQITANVKHLEMMVLSAPYGV